MYKYDWNVFSYLSVWKTKKKSNKKDLEYQFTCITYFCQQCFEYILLNVNKRLLHNSLFTYSKRSIHAGKHNSFIGSLFAIAELGQSIVKSKRNVPIIGCKTPNSSRNIPLLSEFWHIIRTRQESEFICLGLGRAGSESTKIQ